MLLKRGIRKNSGGIEISKSLIRFRRVAKNLQSGGCFTGLGPEPPALGNFVVFFCKSNLILGQL